MKTLEEMTVGEIAARSSAAARVLERNGINFCCSGQIPVTDACLARGLTPSDIVRDLRAATQSERAGLAEWQTSSTASLIDHIVDRHHGYLKTQLPGIQTRLEAVLHQEPPRHRDVLARLLASFRAMREQLESRLVLQETVLFPWLRELDFEEVSASWVPVSVRKLMQGHDATAHALAEIRGITSNYTPPPGARSDWGALYHELRELEIDLHRHFHLENNILFRRAEERNPR